MEPGSDPALTDRRLEGLEGEELIERGRDLAAQPLERPRADRRGGGGRRIPGLRRGDGRCSSMRSARCRFPLACTLVAAHVIAARIKFEVGAGFTVPTSSCSCRCCSCCRRRSSRCWSRSATCSATCPTTCARRRHPQRAVIALADSWYSLAPALVLVAFGAQTRAASRTGPIYVAALVAQSSLDFVVTSLREWYELGRNPLVVVRDWAWVTAVDALLAPIALLAMFTSLDDAFVAAARPAGRSDCSTSSPTSASAGSTTRSSCATPTSARRSCSAT